jgi:beta-glucosidase
MLAMARDPMHSATTPVPREGNWMQMHKAINNRAKQGEIDLIFLGDSITQGWNNNDAWQKHYGNRRAANMGIGGDRTQHVLWRLDNGNVEGLNPKAVVLMIGTNNSNGEDNTAEEIADGIKAIVHKLREKLPNTKILLLGVFPRGEKPNPQRDKINQVNRLISDVRDPLFVQYLDIGNKFLSPDGTISKEVMPDFLHLSPKGYEIWAEAIEPKIAELTAEK